MLDQRVRLEMANEERDKIAAQFIATYAIGVAAGSISEAWGQACITNLLSSADNLAAERPAVAERLRSLASLLASSSKRGWTVH